MNKYKTQTPVEPNTYRRSSKGSEEQKLVSPADDLWANNFLSLLTFSFYSTQKSQKYTIC